MVERDAEYYQAHKDDPEEWGQAQPSRRPKKRRLAAMISVRFAPEEENIVRRAASSRGESVSHFIRLAALRAATLVLRSETAGPRSVPTLTTTTTTTTTTVATSAVEAVTHSARVQLLGDRTEAHACASPSGSS